MKWRLVVHVGPGITPGTPKGIPVRKDEKHLVYEARERGVELLKKTKPSNVQIAGKPFHESKLSANSVDLLYANNVLTDPRLMELSNLPATTEARPEAHEAFIKKISSVLKPGAVAIVSHTVDVWLCPLEELHGLATRNGLKVRVLLDQQKMQSLEKKFGQNLRNKLFPKYMGERWVHGGRN